MSVEGEVNVPGVGATGKKTLMVIAGGGAAYILYRYYKARKDAAAAAAAGANTPGFGDGSGDVLPIVPGATAGVGLANGETTGTVGTNPVDNAAWTQQAEQFLVAAGYDPQAVLKALGDYLASKPLSSDEQSIVQAAIAAAGYPPVGNIHVITGGGDTPVGKVDGVHVIGVSDTAFELDWYATTGASGYHVYEGSHLVATDHGTYHPFTGRKPATSYGPFTVRALNVAGHEGPASDPVNAKTTGTPVVTGGTPISTQKVPYFHVATTTRNSVSLEWGALPGTQHYELKRNGVHLSNENGTWHVDSGLKPNTRYTYSVIAYDALLHASHVSTITAHTNR